MTKRALTAASVARIKPPAVGQAEIFDLGFPGLALRVSYGGQKSWCLFYRASGRLRRMGLGTWPAMSLAEAREAWREARVLVAKGGDPAKPRQAASMVVDAVISEWLKRDQAHNKESYRYQLERVVAHDILPAWGGRSIRDLGKRDVLELLDKISDRGALTKARRVHAHLRRFFGWCVSREIISTNPMTGLTPPGSETARERVLTEDELVRVWNSCSDVPYGAAARLLVLTGSRLAEISELKWAEVEGDEIVLAGARTKTGKPHTIPLSTPARALIESMPRTGEYVFTVDGGHRPISGWSNAKARIDATSGVTGWRLHDLRRTVATGLQKLGVDLQVIESVLGHSGGSRSGIVGVYQRHSYDDEKRAALEAWGAHVTALIEGRQTGKVLPMAGAR